ncbi:alpha/beta fold hydrolase [Streptomyces zhihengii]
MSEIPPNTLQYRVDGPEDAPTLVLGPSLGTTWHMWDRQIAELAERWRLVRFDLPGHGGAPAHPAGSVTDLAERVLATLDGLGVQRFGYAGCSIGGAIGLELALRRPHRVASSPWSPPRPASAPPTSSASAASWSAPTASTPWPAAPRSAGSPPASPPRSPRSSSGPSRWCAPPTPAATSPPARRWPPSTSGPNSAASACPPWSSSAPRTR